MNLDKQITEIISTTSPRVAEILINEQRRQERNFELIASENYPSAAVRAALASCAGNKYAEGYPDLNRKTGRRGRYYGGCEYIDELEEYCCDVWKQLFHTDYHVNVQPHSGTHANFASYYTLLKPGDTILAMSLEAGGHLSHSAPVSQTARFYNVITYGLDENGYINYQEIFDKIEQHHPKLIILGASAYSRQIDYATVAAFLDAVRTSEYNPYLLADIAHISGIIAADKHPSPFGHADIVTTTTQKIIRGPRGGIIFCKPELAKKVDSAIFPATSGGPHEHTIAAKAICAEEAMTAEYQLNYIPKVLENAKAMADAFIDWGYKVITGGTDNHMFLIDLRSKYPNISGAQAQKALERIKITVNKNCVPGETRSPFEASGLRIGTPAMTTLGYDKKTFVEVVERINRKLSDDLSMNTN